MKKPSSSRRRFLKGLGAVGTISVAEWLDFFKVAGVPGGGKLWKMAEARAAEQSAEGEELEPKVLIYWFLEGGWHSYSMFSPLDSANHSSIEIPEGTLYPTPSWGEQRYRVKNYGSGAFHGPITTGNIRHGYLASGGSELFNDLCVVSSHHGNTFHSGGRFEYHYGKTGVSISDYRTPEERTVLQAFCEAKGSGYLLPHISWHRWLADGELAPSNYPEGTGYYEKLGPAHAHTIYGLTPELFRQRLLALGDIAEQARRGVIQTYSNDLYANFLEERQGPTVQSFASALEIYRSLNGGELTVDPRTLFSDPERKAAFGVTSADETTTSREVNGNPARSKNTPHTRAQALMAYECILNKLSCGFWIESRDVRRFDSHRSRDTTLTYDTNSDQTDIINDDLWQPLSALVSHLKSTEMPGLPGRSMWDQTTIAFTSEMGRTIMGDPADILAGPGTDAAKWDLVSEQDVCQHWPVSAFAMMGGNVQGNRQYGGVGTGTMDSIPILPSGALDPAYDPSTGVLIPGRTPDPSAFVTDCGHLYATALKVAGVDPTGRGLNLRPPLDFI